MAIWSFILSLQIACAAGYDPRVSFVTPDASSTFIEGSPVSVRLKVEGEIPEIESDLVLCIGVVHYIDGIHVKSVEPSRDSLHCEANLFLSNETSITWREQPILRLNGIPPGQHVLWAVLWKYSRLSAASRVTSFDLRVSSSEFIPEYMWHDVAAGQTLPHGLEVTMDLSTGRKAARIPSTWRLQVWIDEVHRFFRKDVTADTEMVEINNSAGEMIGVSTSCISLTARDVELEGTARDCSLFELRGSVSFRVRGNCF
jgi:hypothetical protein